MNMAKDSIRRGDVVIVDLGGSVGSEMQNHTTGQGRPCVVVQNDRGNVASAVTIVAPLTDARAHRRHLPVQVLVAGADRGFLKKDSVIHCGQIRSVDMHHRIVRVLGRIPASVIKQVDDALRASLSVPQEPKATC